VPRDATETREALLAAAEGLFADRGVFRTTTKEIVAAAGQGNNSALTYHFGSRQGLLRAIIDRHEAGIDEERGRLLDEVGEGASTRALVGVLLRPFARPLASASGRNYLRIVAQLSDAFPDWREELEGRHLRRALDLLLARPEGLPQAVRQDRVIALISLMTAAMADRAARIDQGRELATDEPTFLGNLADMIVGLLEAPLGPALA
jgi:TetR/AcrR family transcriptional regulator, regulator of cefoperazone and chloramphenicol sensitivity